MKPQELLDTSTTPDGTELVLYERDGVFTIRVDGCELMSSRAHGSEVALAQLVLSRLEATRPRVLVGGLGMGYTLRAVIDVLPPSAGIVVAELLPEVVRWNREYLGHLARCPLDDPRVSLVQSDVAELIAAEPDSFDAFLLDVDNGPSAFTVERNEELYGPRGLKSIRRCLRPGGVLGVWSAYPDPAFEKALRRAGFRARSETVGARSRTKGPRHTIFVAEKTESARG